MNNYDYNTMSETNDFLDRLPEDERNDVVEEAGDELVRRWNMGPEYMYVSFKLQGTKTWLTTNMNFLPKS
jgi:hypothetical protein